MSGRSQELFELLDGGGVVLGDGAMGTLLQTRGIEPGGAAELWNVDHASTIAAIHTEYAEAPGARLVTTNTFGGNERAPRTSRPPAHRVRRSTRAPVSLPWLPVLRTEPGKSAEPPEPGGDRLGGPPARVTQP